MSSNSSVTNRTQLVALFIEDPPGPIADRGTYLKEAGRVNLRAMFGDRSL